MNTETLFIKVLNMSITAGYVILALLLFRLLLKRAPKKFSYLLWAAALFRLVSPVSFSSLFSLFQMKPFDMTAAQQQGEAALSYIPADIGYRNQPRLTVGIPTMNTVISESLPPAATAASVNPIQVWIAVGSILWVLGIAFLLLYHLGTYLRLRHRIATAMRLKNNLYESDKIRSPFILGFFKPRIYLPCGLAEPERDYILRHEQIHLKRKDHWIKPCSLCILTLHWFNPLVWLAYFLMVKDMEMSCDEKVLATLDSGIARAYSLSLLSFAANRRFLAANPLAFGETSVKKRIQNILRFQKTPKWAVVFASLLCLAVVVACAANPKPKGNNSFYGNYIFQQSIYMNPLSSFLASENYTEYYTLTEKDITITSEWGNQTTIPITYQKTIMNKQNFKKDFLMEDFGVPDLSSYRQCYQLTAGSGSAGYRLYQIDGDLWVVRLHQTPAEPAKTDYIWSIYQITPFDGEFPRQFPMTETQDGVETFLSLQKDFQSGYEEDLCYQVTPEYIRENSNYQIFKYDTSAASFLLYEHKVYPLGEWFGGFGVTSAAIADLNQDEIPELYFTYSWGSGLHRSHVAYFDPAQKQMITLPYTHFNGDLMLAAKSNECIILYAASIPDCASFTQFEIEPTEQLSTVVWQKDAFLLSPLPKG